MAHDLPAPGRPDPATVCTGPGCCGSTTRREFLQLLGVGMAALAAGPAVMAGPFDAADFDKLVPANKKLSPDWVRSLFERGQRTFARGAELDKIGMPVGGIG